MDTLPALPLPSARTVTTTSRPSTYSPQKDRLMPNSELLIMTRNVVQAQQELIQVLQKQEPD
ncbi:hypothetical protein [Spirosoma linguale]|uniref:Uncharacterized protein n=1 Tax=Spirosoma linguale (strain ATCC 33905 / DSM 74 / LMG 10896 / Claus 1) TaxID=504472 RepID=D2QPZ4_SPILD|nr:hypothetical protein Slin_1681 [Spirosoma linguale DSM 74]